MKVVRWISYEQAKDLPDHIGGMGGFFNFSESGQRWRDYLEGLSEVGKPYAEALRQEILAKKLRFSGGHHQADPEGTPVFEDGSVACFSMRAWGDLMAAVWSEEENTDYSYCDFAW